jgi:hypothetical protein
MDRQDGYQNKVNIPSIARLEERAGNGHPGFSMRWRRLIGTVSAGKASDPDRVRRAVAGAGSLGASA